MSANWALPLRGARRTWMKRTRNLLTRKWKMLLWWENSKRFTTWIMYYLDILSEFIVIRRSFYGSLKMTPELNHLHYCDDVINNILSVFVFPFNNASAKWVETYWHPWSPGHKLVLYTIYTHVAYWRRKKVITYQLKAKYEGSKMSSCSCTLYACENRAK